MALFRERYSKYASRKNNFLEIIRENLSIVKISFAKLAHFGLSSREKFIPQFLTLSYNKNAKNSDINIIK